ncbi:MAG: hypothetical protein GY820_09310 [Gammaproteobacteria bacterium]|nr:hypothetical protein [Gammaproteobacteria bacterium]
MKWFVFSGNHQYIQTTENLYDYSLKKFSELGIDKEIVTVLERIPEAMHQFGEEEFSGQLEPVGFAVKRTAKRTEFSVKVKRYLTNKFLEGDRLHKKPDARDIVTEMRAIKSKDGTPVFTTGECLTWQQITSFWSQNAQRLRLNAAQAEADPQQEVEDEVDDDTYLHDNNIQPTEDNILENAMNEAASVA